MIALKLSAANIIYRGIKRISNPERMLDILCIPLEAVLCLSADPLNLFQDIKLYEEDKRILSFVDGSTVIKDIVSLSKINESETLKTLYALLSVRLIEIKGEDGANAGLSAADIIEEHEIKIDEEFMSRIEKIHSEHEKMGYYGILGVKQWASTDDIKRHIINQPKSFIPTGIFILIQQQ